MRARYLTLFLLLGVLLLGVGCKQQQAGVQGVGHSAEGVLTEAEKGQVLAKVGDHRITLEEFERRLNQQSPFARTRYNSLQKKREFLDGLIRFELLALAAKKSGFDTHPDVVLARKQAMVRQLTAEEIQNLVKMSDIKDADVQSYYTEHQAKYDKPAEMRAAHIVLADEAAAKALLAEIQTKIKADPPKARDIFAEAAKAHSIDEPTKGKGGDLDYFGQPGKSRANRGPLLPMVPPPVALAAYALKKNGEIVAEPVHSSMGWHLIQRTGYRRPFRRELKSVSANIRNTLFRVRKGKAMQAYVKNLRDQANVEIDEKVLAEIRVKAPRKPAPNIAPPKIGPDGRLVRPGAPK